MALNLREYLRLDFATNLRYLLAKINCSCRKEILY